jgi:hypothetical protein
LLATPSWLRIVATKAFVRDVDADVNVIDEVEDNMWLRVPLNTQPGDS